MTNTEMKRTRNQKPPSRAGDITVNQRNEISQIRQITTPSANNSSERAELMRRVHPTYIGYICLIGSPECDKAIGSG